MLESMSGRWQIPLHGQTPHFARLLDGPSRLKGIGALWNNSKVHRGGLIGRCTAVALPERFPKAHSKGSQLAALLPASCRVLSNANTLDVNPTALAHCHMVGKLMPS